MAKIVYKAVEYFSIADYIVFSLMLTFSLAVGIYYYIKRLCFEKGSESTIRELLSGGKNLKPFPIAMSLVASYVSGITVLGTPAEIYRFGTEYSVIIFAILLSGVVIIFVYIPVFYTLQVHSSYEYLEIRFSKSIRTVASVFFVIDEILFLPFLVYVPALCFNQVTGVNIYIIGTVTTIICLAYTLLGGLEGVVWVDTIQTLVMFLGVLAVLIIGMVNINPTEIWDIGIKGGRVKFINNKVNFYERNTVFNVIIGGFSYWLCFNAVHQTMVQKYVGLPTIMQARIAFGIFIVGVGSFILMCSYIGLILFAYFSECDPALSNQITLPDQIFPLFVMQNCKHLYGIPGLFTSAVFGAAMSSLAIVLHATSTVVLEDLVNPFMKKPLSEKISAILIKCVAVFLAVYSILSIWMVEKMGGVLGLAISLSAVAASVTGGIFSLGMLFPWANTKGAMGGAIVGGLLTLLMSLGSAVEVYLGHLPAPVLEGFVHGCPDELNARNYTKPNYEEQEKVFGLFRLSFHWVAPFGFLTVIAVGILISFATKFADLKTMDPDIISPISQWALPKEAQEVKGTAIKTLRLARGEIIL